MRKRWKAEDVLAHPWIVSQGNSKTLPPNYEEFRHNFKLEVNRKTRIYAAEALPSK